MKGYDLMTKEQQEEWANLEEKDTHSETMRFTGLDGVHLAEYRALAVRLEVEFKLQNQAFE